MLNVIFAVQSRDVGASQGATTLMTEEIQSSEIVSLAEWELATSIVRVHGEELGSDDFPTVLQNEPRLAQAHSPRT